MVKQNYYTIKGTTISKDGQPLAGLTVRAFDQDPTGDNPLGFSVTDDGGFYQIRYRDEDFRLGGKESGGADIILRIYDEADDLIYETEPLRNAGNDVRIDLSIELPGQRVPFRLNARDKRRLNSLSRGLRYKNQREKLEALFQEAQGDFSRLSTLLEESEEFDEPTTRQLDFANGLADLTGDNEELVGVFLSDKSANSLRDIALNFNKYDLKAAVEDAGFGDEAETIAVEMHDRLFRMEPAAAIQRMIRDREIEDDENVRDGLLTFFNKHEPDFQKSSVLNILKEPDALEDIPEEDRGAVVRRLKSLQRLSAVSLKAEALPRLWRAGLDSAYAINEVPLERFVALYGADLGGEDEARKIHAQAQTISVRNEHAYVALREAVLGTPIAMIQGGLSVDARMALVVEMAEDKNIPINFETLFGSVNLCECEHCNSVYSPAAYLVELFQYLRNNNLDPFKPFNEFTGVAGIEKTVLEKLFRRRPDLGNLQLTCENTNTLIPYIDLVNEVMESFVVHLEDYETDNQSPKQACITAYNVEDESSGELLAEPQHTFYKAYEILKDAVYPVCKLPYHQPIDATRNYLDFLGTSRYELLDTFRKDISLEPDSDNPSPVELDLLAQQEALEVQAVDRAIAAEFLHLSEEEFVILTKEGFHTKKWYELENGATQTLAQYQQEIGLKDTWAYYGLASEAQMLDELKWVKPAQESGQVGFLRRVNIRFVDLVELLKTQYINPNYLSGKALAYMNSLRYSYRYLQSLVDEDQTDLKLKYQALVELLTAGLASDATDPPDSGLTGLSVLASSVPSDPVSTALSDLESNFTNPFDKDFIECWVYKYFAKVGKLIVLENAPSCNCIEGTIRLSNIEGNSPPFISLTLDSDCQLHITGSDPINFVGHLDTSTGKLVLDANVLAGFIESGQGIFVGNNGEIGEVKNLILYIEGQPFVCIDSQETCDISNTQLKHLDGTDLVTAEYDRMHRFVRLWCKLGWSIAEVDQAITGIGETANNSPSGPTDFTVSNTFVAFQPVPPPPEDDGEDNPLLPGSSGNTLVTPVVDPQADCQPEPISQVLQDITPYLIEQLAAVKKLQEITGLELAKLLAYWTSIGTAGENSLYKRLFLKYNLIAVDTIFQEDNFGTYLTEGAAISDHLPVLMAALKADVGMLETIMTYAGLADELTLPNVSHLYRHLLLAKSLGLRVKQLPPLFELIKDEAHPFGQPTNTLKFYQLFARIDDSGFNSSELNYMIRDEDDPDRPLRPDSRDIFQLVVTLRNALLQIEIDHPDIIEDDEATEEFLRAKLSLLFDDAVVEQIIGLVQGTTVYQDNTRRKYSTQLEQSDQDNITAFLQEQRKQEEEDPGGLFETFLPRVQFRGTNGLQVTGILSEPDQGLLIALANNIDDNDDEEKFLIVVHKILAQPERFFEDAFAPIFPTEEDAANAKTILLAEDTLIGEEQEDSSLQKRAFLARAFLPYLREQLRQRQVTQILASDLGLEPDVTAKLVMEVIKTATNEALYDEIIRLKAQKDEGEAQDPLVWAGFFIPEKDGKYTFLLEAEGEATLTFNNESLWTGPKETDEEQINFYQSEPLFLKSGQAYPFLLEGYDEDDDEKIIGLFMKFNDQPQTEIPDKVLFPALRTEAFKNAYIHLQKAAMLVSGFGMELTELEFFRDFPDNFAGLDFNALSFLQWLRLEAFYRLQKSLKPADLSLIEFLLWTNRTDEAEPEPSLAANISALTGWVLTDVEKLIEPPHFNLSHPEHFRDEKNLLKLQETLKVARKIGVGIDLLFQWGDPNSGFTFARKMAGDIREAIRARYTQEEWEEVIKPVHDQLRENQKQALIAYLLAQPVLMDWGVRDADSLFEFFLIDVQMDACMETSRIKQAISSVQLYVQRCFLGLEEAHGVGSKVLDRQRWEWMSRYRVWEANRKVFLYPENWIRPELRDDKSPFFQELESELLQNDVSQATVKSALYRYIVQVDEVANLQVIGQYDEGNNKTGKLHVIGRTRYAPYFYYYRYYKFDTQYWYPWEKIEVDIPSIDIEDSKGRIINNGVFVTPVVWMGRLFIFFPQFMRKNWESRLQKKMKVADAGNNTKIDENVPLRFWEIKMGYSEYKEGKWTPKQLSKDAVYTIINSIPVPSGLLDEPTNNLNGPQNDNLDLLQETEKFMFAPFIKETSLVIQPYYLGQVTHVTEKLTGGGEKFTREVEKSDATIVKIDLDKAFRFDGHQLRLVDKVSAGIVPDGWNYAYEFHILMDTGDVPYLLPIQANGNEINPGQDWLPAFLEEQHDAQVKVVPSSTIYKFHHPLTKILLGYLRKDQLKNIFNNGIPLDDDNYGSDDALQYHELKRPYALYNWEALFHSVSLLADNLSKAQRFEEAMAWWHYIFDPIGVQGDIKNVWKFLPFQVTDSINVLEKIFNRLEPNTPDDEINEWRDNPFQPHVIARSRPSAYMKWVVMKYIDNLIAWGDSLFRQDTIESLNQATQLYILAAHILGPRPEFIPRRGNIQPKSYMDLVDEWDAFSNAIVDLELIFPFSNQIAVSTIPDSDPHYINIYGFATTLYFCIPNNPRLLAYWDTVADRLFKIRHCLNIEGVFRKLNLFEPPIDPALLVGAAAQGLSIGSVLNDLSTPMPNYRFNYLLARALEVTSEVKSLGSALLSALEKKDGETISLLRSRHDLNIQTLIMEVRKKQLEEAEKTMESLKENRKAPEHRLEHYQQLAGEEVSIPTIDAEFTLIENNIPEVKEESGLKLIGEEVEEIKKAKKSRDLQIGVGSVETLAGILSLIPNFSVDGKPVGIGAGLDFGGRNLGPGTQAIARGLQIGVNVASAQSTGASRKGGYKRRLNDNLFQANLAGREIKQIDKQITAQQIRMDIAQNEIDNHQVQIDQADEIEAFLRTKFSNDQLYHWMSDQLRNLYYQTYSFAYDLAKKAEKVYRFEMGLATSDFVKFGYWNSAKEGFLAGEQLYLALKQLENAYVESKPYDYEITKHISLRQVNPLALIQLKESGVCEFELHEELFDLDFPGHYKRRIKTVSVSIPCIIGPYTSLNCTLRLLKHEYRNSKIAANYPKNLEEADERFISNPLSITAIAVSGGQNDSGVFELNFRDERYLPFEGAGAISSLRLELPQTFRQFNYQTITDVIIHLRYTACEGGELLKTAALEHLDTYVGNAAELSKTEGLYRLLSLPNEFPSEWHHFLTSEAENPVLQLGELKERFPFFAKSQQVQSVCITEARLITAAEGLELSLLCSEHAESLITNPDVSEELPEGTSIENLHQYVNTDLSEELNGFWGLQFSQLEPMTIEQLTDAWLVFKYEINIG